MIKPLKYRTKVINSENCRHRIEWNFHKLKNVKKYIYNKIGEEERTVYTSCLSLGNTQTMLTVETWNEKNNNDLIF